MSLVKLMYGDQIPLLFKVIAYRILKGFIITHGKKHQELFALALFMNRSDIIMYARIYGSACLGASIL
jgi:hypothetical protein